MDKLQFLDFTDVNPSEEEELINILYNVDFQEAVEMPPETLPPWAQHPVSYEVESLNGGGEPMVGQAEQPVDYAVASPHMMSPHTMQYTQMMTQPNVFVNNVTANVNVHSFIPPQPVPYPPVPYLQPVDTTSRKARPAKSPTKRSPEARPAANFTPAFSQPFTPTLHPYAAGYYHHYSMHSPHIPRHFPMPPAVFSPTGYSGFPPVFTAPHPTAVQQPTVEPREDNSVAFVEPVPQEVEYQPQVGEEEGQEQIVDTVIVENSTIQQNEDEERDGKEEKEEEVAMPVVEVPPVEAPKVDKPLITKAPPANAFKSAPNPMQKPPFPTQSTRQKRTSVDNGPQFVDPPVETGPPRKSYAQMAQSSEFAAVKPLAMIHPTVHASLVNVSTRPQNCMDKPNATPPAQDHLNTNNVKVQPEKMIMADYDINLQRLGEFLTSYQLDHKPLPLQPRGLTNRSNYCYINAILQALIACPPFFNLMKSIPPSQENKNGKSRTPIIDSMVKFVNEFEPMSLRVGRKEKAQATKDGVTPGVCEVVAGTTFEPTYIYKMLSAMHALFPVEGRQEDAEEFLSCLLNGLNDEMLEAIKLTEPQSNGLTNGDVTSNGGTTNGDHDDMEQDHEWSEVVNKNKSVVTRRAEFGRTPLSAIFRGQMRSRLFRPGVENGTTDNIQPFFTLQLDVERSSSVEKALELLVGRDEVVGGVCPKTNQQLTMSTQTSLEELPLILLLHLKCFHYKLHTCSKIIKTVEFPVDLKIDNKLMPGKSKAGSKDRQYKLLAVVYHDGKEATKGHYVTDVFHTGYSCWVRYDDATVRPVTQQQVLNPKIPRVPYLLYYRRCDTINQPQPLPQDKNR